MTNFSLLPIIPSKYGWMRCSLNESSLTRLRHKIQPWLVVIFMVRGQYVTQLWQVKVEIFGNSMIFQLHRVHISKTIYRRGTKPSLACSPFNSAQNKAFWCISDECLGVPIVLIDDALSHRWRHRSDLGRHVSVTWHAHMIGISTTKTLPNCKITFQLESTTTRNSYYHKLCDLM